MIENYEDKRKRGEGNERNKEKKRGMVKRNGRERRKGARGNTRRKPSMTKEERKE